MKDIILAEVRRRLEQAKLVKAQTEHLHDIQRIAEGEIEALTSLERWIEVAMPVLEAAQAAPVPPAEQLGVSEAAPASVWRERAARWRERWPEWAEACAVVAAQLERA